MINICTFPLFYANFLWYRQIFCWNSIHTIILIRCWISKKGGLTVGNDLSLYKKMKRRKNFFHHKSCVSSEKPVSINEWMMAHINMFAIKKQLRAYAYGLTKLTNLLTNLCGQIFIAFPCLCKFSLASTMLFAIKIAKHKSWK